MFETTYGIMLPKPREGEEKSRPVYASELLNAYGCKCTVFILIEAGVFVSYKPGIYMSPFCNVLHRNLFTLAL